MRDSQEKFAPATIALHWIVGLTVIGLLGVGTYMNKTETWSLYPIHKSTGVAIFAIILARVVWRMMNGLPVPTGNHANWEITLSRVVQWSLIIGTVLMPISGMMMSGAGGHGIPLFGIELLAPNPDPANPGKMIPLNAMVAGIGHETHEIVSKLLILAVVLHFSAAMKHHFFDKDGTLRRMLGGRV